MASPVSKPTINYHAHALFVEEFNKNAPANEKSLEGLTRCVVVTDAEKSVFFVFYKSIESISQLTRKINEEDIKWEILSDRIFEHKKNTALTPPLQLIACEQDECVVFFHEQKPRTRGPVQKQRLNNLLLEHVPGNFPAKVYQWNNNANNFVKNNHERSLYAMKDVRPAKPPKMKQ